jgi:sec-independent protein translocase protein TatB
MFGIGGSELLIIVFVALLVFGPSRLPEIARTVKRGYQEWARLGSD